MAESAKLTGKAASFTYNATVIPFKVIKADSEVDFADSTDSSNYDSDTDLVHKSQVQSTTQTTLSVEGFFDLNTTDTALITQLYSGAPAVNATFSLKAGVVYGHGLFDLTKFSTSIPVDDIVGWTAEMKSHGKFTRGS